MFFKRHQLSINAKHKNFEYISHPKVEQFLLRTEIRGWNVSANAVGVAGAGIGMTAVPKSNRDFLTEIGKLLKKQNELCDEDNPQPGSYLLLRLVASAGTMWPWKGRREGMEETAWWVGEGKDVTVLAYGSLENLLQQGGFKSKSDESTWFPSVADTHYDLIDSIKVDREYAKVPAGLKVRALLEECFNGGLLERDAPRLKGPGIYEMLLRVDGVDSEPKEDEAEAKKRIVYGSPVWVARVSTPTPGVYKLNQKHPEPGGIRVRDMTYEMTGYARGEGLKGNLTGNEIAGSQLDAYGVWDGKSWVKTYWARGIFWMPIDDSAGVPATPQGSPSPKDAVSLGIPLNLRKKFFKRWEWDKTPLSPRNPNHVILG